MIKRVNKSNPLNDCCSDETIMLISALSDKTRQGIIRILAQKDEIRASDIAEKFTLSRPTISHHLNLMKRAKLLLSRKEGKEVYYSLNKVHTIKEMEAILNIIKNSC